VNGVPIGLPLQAALGEVICPYCRVLLRYPIGSDVVRCGACQSLARIPPPQHAPPQQQQQQLAPPQQQALQQQRTPQQQQQQQQPPSQLLASQPLPAGVQRVQFPCACCALWLAADVKADGSALSRCPRCETIMRPVVPKLNAQQQQQQQQQQQLPQPVAANRSAVVPPLQQQLLANQHLPAQAQQPRRVVSPAGLSPALQAQYQAQAAAQPAWLQAQHQAVLEQQQALLAEAARAKAGLKTATARQHGAALAASAGSNYVGLTSPTPPASSSSSQRQQQRSVVGDYSGYGSSSLVTRLPPQPQLAQQAAPLQQQQQPQQQARYAPAGPPSPSFSAAAYYPNLNDSFEPQAPYVALSDESPARPSPVTRFQQQQPLQQQPPHQPQPVAVPIAASSTSYSSPSSSSFSSVRAQPECKEETEAAVLAAHSTHALSHAEASADAAYAAQMARRLEALQVSDEHNNSELVDNEEANVRLVQQLEVSDAGSINASPSPPPAAAARNRPVKVKGGGAKDKAQPLLANLM
jgi:LSD1 subclass zinc finger protein